MNSFIVTLTGGLIVAAFVYWLNYERYDLRYTVSDKIPIRFGEQRMKQCSNWMLRIWVGKRFHEYK